MALGGGGVALVTNTLEGIDGSSNNLVGVLLLLSAVICCAFYSVFSRKLSQQADPIVAVALQQAAGLTWAIALLLAGTPYGSVSDIAAIPLHLIAASALAGLMYYELPTGFSSRRCDMFSRSCSSYFNLIPVFGIGLAYLLRGKSLRQFNGQARWLFLFGFWPDQLTTKVQTIPQAPPDHGSGNEAGRHT